MGAVIQFGFNRDQLDVASQSCSTAAVHPTAKSANARAFTAPYAVGLAEEALKAGKIDNAICYLNMAYAIFDLNAERLASRLSASRPSVGQT